VLRSDEYDGVARIPVNSYAGLIRGGGWDKRALEMASQWPEPVTFSRKELMSKSWGGDAKSSHLIKRFCELYERIISPQNLSKYLDITHCLLLPSRLPEDWEEFTQDDVPFLNNHAAHTRKGFMGNLRRDWLQFLKAMSFLVRKRILSPSEIMDPSIPIFPKNKMGWVAYGGDELFGGLLEEVDRNEPHQIWYWQQKLKHPFWAELVKRYPKFAPADAQDV
jgi:hypothetical protein